MNSRQSIHRSIISSAVYLVLPFIQLLVISFFSVRVLLLPSSIRQTFDSPTYQQVEAPVARHVQVGARSDHEPRHLGPRQFKRQEKGGVRVMIELLQPSRPLRHEVAQLLQIVGVHSAVHLQRDPIPDKSKKHVIGCGSDRSGE